MFLKEAFLVLRESEDDETPQRARELLEYTSLFPGAEDAHCEAVLEGAAAPIIPSEEAHREPAASVVYFRSGKRHQPPLILRRSLYLLRRLKATAFSVGRVADRSL